MGHNRAEEEKRISAKERLIKQGSDSVAMTGKFEWRKLEPKDLGRYGEEAAAELLRRKDYVILERNWSCVFGEADIIALDEDCLVFVEVKTRNSIEYGFPEEAVTSKKRARYERIASAYLDCYDGPDARVRFDVISVQGLAGNRAFVRHIVNAFAAGE